MNRPLFQKVDALIRRDHWYLGESDDCIFTREYTPGKGYVASDTNNLVPNFKKQPDKKGKPEWRHKIYAIDQITREFTAAIDLKKMLGVTFVPMPPSKSKTDPLYDDRMVQVLLRMQQAEPSLDVRELLVRSKSTPAAHTGQRPKPEEHFANLEIDEKLSSPAPTRVVLFDDVLVTGAQFVAAKARLQRRFSSLENVVGFFLARRVPAADEWPPVADQGEK